MTPKEFYHSSKWKKLIEVLKVERADENGVIICEHCGQPIVRKYDCIGHHKIHLNESNIDDANVSLNPDNIALIHFKCHNEIHDRWQGGRAGYHIEPPKVYLVYGSPCSGKTTWVEDVAKEDDLILDVDKIWDAICIGGHTQKPKRLTSNVFGIRDVMIEMIKIRKGKWRNAYIIGGYPLRSDRERMCTLLDAEPVYIEASKEECLLRARSSRPDGWEKYIEDWFATFTE